MKRYLAPLLATTTLFSTIAPAWGQEPVASKVTFVCQEQQGVSTTIAKNIDGELQPVFHWKNDLPLLEKMTAQELCQVNTQKLNDYFAQGYDPSKFVLEQDNLQGVPAICLPANQNSFSSCSQVLLALYPTDNISDDTRNIEKTLKTIKDENLQVRWEKEFERLTIRLHINLFNNKQ